MSSKIVNLTNKTSFFTKHEDNIFSNLYLIGGILLISLFFAAYGFYYYTKLNSESVILANSSYYGTDIALYEPIFQDTTKTVIDCITTCNSDITCDGITYNNNTQACLGTKNGQVRNETSNYSAWVKPPVDNDINPSKDFKKSIVIGYTKINTVINGQKMHSPYAIGYFSYSFNITIYDFNKNYGNWRHIFHKGSSIDTGTILNYQSWENLIKDYPMQSIGVWLAPFTNNIRIAITTTSMSNNAYGSYTDAFIEKCDTLTGECYITDTPGRNWAQTSPMNDGSNPKTKLEKYIEYFDHDIQNLPINKQVLITVVFRGRDAEILFNDKIVKIFKLDGVPTTNKSNLYVMNDKSFGGEISNLLYYQDALKIEDVKNIMKLSPNTT